MLSDAIKRNETAEKYKWLVLFFLLAVFTGVGPGYFFATFSTPVNVTNRPGTSTEGNTTTIMQNPNGGLTDGQSVSPTPAVTSYQTSADPVSTTATYSSTKEPFLTTQDRKLVNDTEKYAPSLQPATEASTAPSTTTKTSSPLIVVESDPTTSSSTVTQNGKDVNGAGTTTTSLQPTSGASTVSSSTTTMPPAVVVNSNSTTASTTVTEGQKQMNGTEKRATSLAPPSAASTVPSSTTLTPLQTVAKSNPSSSPLVPTPNTTACKNMGGDPTFARKDSMTTMGGFIYKRFVGYVNLTRADLSCRRVDNRRLLYVENVSEWEEVIKRFPTNETRYWMHSATFRNGSFYWVDTNRSINATLFCNASKAQELMENNNAKAVLNIPAKCIEVITAKESENLRLHFLCKENVLMKDGKPPTLVGYSPPTPVYQVPNSTKSFIGYYQATPFIDAAEICSDIYDGTLTTSNIHDSVLRQNHIVERLAPNDPKNTTEKIAMGNAWTDLYYDVSSNTPILRRLSSADEVNTTDLVFCYGDDKITPEILVGLSNFISRQKCNTRPWIYLHKQFNTHIKQWEKKGCLQRDLKAFETGKDDYTDMAAFICEFDKKTA